MPPSTPEKPRKQAKATKSAAKGPASTFLKPLQPSPELAAIVGTAPLPRPEVVSKVWEYIKKHKLQNPQNKREIMADEKGDVTLTGNTALYSSRKNCVLRKISDLACAKAGLIGPLNDYTQLM